MHSERPIWVGCLFAGLVVALLSLMPLRDVAAQPTPRPAPPAAKAAGAPSVKAGAPKPGQPALSDAIAAAATPQGEKPALNDSGALERLGAIQRGSLARRELSTAEGELLALAEACLDCSPELQARLWVMVGAIRSAQSDEVGAVAAFRRGFTLDPTTQLDAASVSDPQTVITFERVQAEVDAALAGRAQPVERRLDPADEKIPLGGEPGTLECTPEVRRVEALRPIPMHCIQQDPNQPRPARMEIAYRSYDSDEAWARVRMNAVKDGYQATIPCRATQKLGKLEVLVRGLDAEGKEVEFLGDSSNPIVFEIRHFTHALPPAFPGRAPPPKCEASEQCPPGIPGCVAGGEPLCVDDGDCAPGRCDPSGACIPRACQRQSDCGDGAACVTGTCQVVRKRHYRLSLQVALDVAVGGGRSACRGRDEGREFGCFLPGTDVPYAGIAQPGNAGDASFGLVPGNLRFLLGYDIRLAKHIALALRGGIAVGGEPDLEASRFVPVHGELRGQYTFLPQARVRPYAALGGGLATVDTRYRVEIVDCGEPESADFDPRCATSDALQEPRRARDVDAVQRFGPVFVGGALGTEFWLTQVSGLRLEVGYAQLFPNAGGVFEPALGYVVAF